jgi:RNA polymerase sigma-70 factor, ECF subfamily
MKENDVTLHATSVPAGGTLLERAQAGDETAFRILAEPFVDIGYRLAFAMLRQREAAEDAVQEATLLAWRRLRQLRDEAGLRTWYLTIVANQCRTQTRGRWWGVLRFAEPLPSSRPADDDTDHAGVTDLRRSVERLRLELQPEEIP